MKNIIILAAVAAMVLFTACEKKKTATAEEVKTETTTLGTDAKTELVVENLVSTDRQAMFNQYGKEYRWFETCVLLKDFLDEENDGSITGVSNVFQFVKQDGTGFDVSVVLFSHVGDQHTTEVKDAFWLEDHPMNDEAIKVTFKEAYEKVMATNLPKPHSRHAVLRKQVGAKDANPQWIFGNTKAQIYVDANTGEVSDKNPAFDAELGAPLGEWP